MCKGFSSDGRDGIAACRSDLVCLNPMVSSLWWFQQESSQFSKTIIV